MKKFLALILSFLFVAFSFLSCNSSNPEQQIETHTSHTPDKGKCSVCGLDFFNELVDLLKNGTYHIHSTDSTIDNAYGVYDGISDYYMVCSKKNDQVEIHSRNSNGLYVIIIRKGSLQTNTFDWAFHGKKMSQDIYGTLNPTTFPSNGALEMASYGMAYTEDKAVSELSQIKLTFSEMISEVFMPLLDKSKNNLNPSDYGFINY